MILENVRIKKPMKTALLNFFLPFLAMSANAQAILREISQNQARYVPQDFALNLSLFSN